jgi:aryl-alcohol dehydrogenase-like predicted oxidoreductase
MKYGEIKGLDKPVSRIVQGTGFINTKDRKEMFQLLDAALDAGINTFDTAHFYGQGEVERIFGQWMHDRQNRDEIVLIAKGGHHNQDRSRVTPFDIESDIHDSMARLQTDYFDIYMLHRDDTSVPVDSIIEKLHQYQQKGIIGIYGGSNWTSQRIREANDFAGERSCSPFMVSSPHYSLADRVNEPWQDCITISGPSRESERAWYRESQLPVFTWSSLAGGFFSGRFNRDNLDTFTEHFDVQVLKAYIAESNFQRLDRVKALATEKGTSLTQIAVAFVFNQPMNLYALLGSRTLNELHHNIEALDIELSDEECVWLDLQSHSRGSDSSS